MIHCPFCPVAPFQEREEARSHLLESHPEKVKERLARIPERTRSHMVDPTGWAAGALLSEHTGA